jgi:hypothetical protein
VNYTHAFIFQGNSICTDGKTKHQALNEDEDGVDFKNLMAIIIICLTTVAFEFLFFHIRIQTLLIRSYSTKTTAPTITKSRIKNGLIEIHIGILNLVLH